MIHKDKGHTNRWIGYQLKTMVQICNISDLPPMDESTNNPLHDEWVPSSREEGSAKWWRNWTRFSDDYEILPGGCCTITSQYTQLLWITRNYRNHRPAVLELHLNICSEIERIHPTASKDTEWWFKKQPAEQSFMFKDGRFRLAFSRYTRPPWVGL